MADDPNVPPELPPPPAKSRLRCEFCECALASSGEVLKMGARAKELARLETTIETLQRDLAAARAREAELAADLHAAQHPGPAPAPAARSAWE